MADEEKNEQTEEQTAEETPEETPAETPAEETQAEETPAEEAPAEEGPADEVAEETPEEVEAPAGEADSNGSDEETGEAEDASSDAGDALEGLDWKARRRLEHSRRSAEARPQQSPEERAAARGESRKQAAARRSSYRTKARTKSEKGTGTPRPDRESAGSKTRQGRVVSSKPDKTITVAIEIARRHPQYEKIVRRSRTLSAHDAHNEAGEGDLVRIIETRPLSRTKRWRLIEILEKAK
jgi:small subunit ribosomal protein S17